MPENCLQCGKFVSETGVCTFCVKQTNISSASNPNLSASKTPVLPTVTFKKISELSHLIHHDFSGNIDELQSFIDDYSLVNSYCPNDLKQNLMTEIMSHITHAARADLQGRKDLRTWDLLHDYLKLKYKYQFTWRSTLQSIK